MFSATFVQVASGIAIVISSIGGAAGVAVVVRYAFIRHRNEARREDMLWGWVDENGGKHPGLVEQFNQHINDASIHIKPTNGWLPPKG